MKTKTKQLLLAITMMAGVFFVITAFTNKPETKKTYYAFVTAIELDKSSDTNVFLTTNIVSFDCERTTNELRHQFLQHYWAEEENSSRTIKSDFTSSYIYDSYDQAMEARRENLANSKSLYKLFRNTSFYVSCK